MKEQNIERWQLIAGILKETKLPTHSNPDCKGTNPDTHCGLDCNCDNGCTNCDEGCDCKEKRDLREEHKHNDNCDCKDKNDSEKKHGTDEETPLEEDIVDQEKVDIDLNEIKIKVTKTELKEMIRESILPTLNEMFDRADHEWNQSIQQEKERTAILGMLKNTLNAPKMPGTVRQKMAGVISALEDRTDILQALAKRPENKKKIAGALERGEFDAIANALENIFIKAPARTN